MLTSFNFRWVVTQRLPTVSYLTLLDKYAIIGLLYLGYLACWFGLIGSNLFNDNNRYTVDSIMLYILVCLFIIFNIFYFSLVLFKYLNYEKIDKIVSPI